MRSSSLPSARTLVRIGASIAALVTCVCAQAQNYPSRPLRYVVAFVPGGINDILARIVGQKLSEAWGQPVIVDNRPGAGGNLGTELVAKSSPDGYTLLNISTAQAISATLYSKLGYNLERDLAPVALLGSSPLIIGIHPGVTARTVAEFANASKQKPFSYASGGVGTISHLSGEMLKRALGFNMTHVPYKGAGPGVTDVMGGQVQMMFDNMASSMPQIKAGKLKAFAVTTPKRSALAPDLPTMAEAGVKDFDVFTWWGLFAPAGTPPELVKRLSLEVNKALSAPDLREKWLASGAEPAASAPEEFKAFIGKELTKYARIVKESGAKVD